MKYLKKYPNMHCEAQLGTLIYLLTYASCISEVSCSNDTPKSEEYHSSVGMPINSNESDSGVPFGKERSNANEKTLRPPVFSEGESGFPVGKEKINDINTSTSVQNGTLNDKGLQFALQYGFNDTSGPSTDHKQHKGRKGVTESNETNSEENPVEYSSVEALQTTKSGKEPVNAASVTSLTNSTFISSAVNITTNSFSTPTTDNSKNLLEEHTNEGMLGVNMTSNATSSLDSKNSTAGKLNTTKVLTYPKPKPEFTRDDNDNSYYFTNPESDYVIPIVATIFAAPLLIVLAMFLYKRSKEFWERRHYRRMDFLIDGMYND